MDKSKNLDVWVIEDDLVMREVFVDLLEEGGHRVRAFADLPRMDPPADIDRIVVDLSLPSGSAWSWIEAAARVLRRPARIVVTTASGDPATFERARAAGFAYLPKPFRPEDLDRVLAEGA